MTEPTEKIEKPSDRITITYGLSDANLPAQPRDLFMSAGLVRNLAAVVSTHASMVDLYTDASMQSYMMVEVLKPRTKHGESIAEYKLEDFDITIDEADRLSQWVIGHVIYFFLSAVQKVRTAMEDPESNLMKLAASMTGSQDSAIDSQSAGDTDAK